MNNAVFKKMLLEEIRYNHIKEESEESDSWTELTGGKSVWGISSSQNNESLRMMLMPFIKTEKNTSGWMELEDALKLTSAIWELVSEENIVLEQLKIRGDRSPDASRTIEEDGTIKLLNYIGDNFSENSKKIAALIDKWAKFNTIGFEMPQRQRHTEPAEPAKPEVDKITDEEIASTTISAVDKLELDLPPEEKKNLITSFIEDMKALGAIGWKAQPLSKVWNIIKAIKEGNYAAIPANIILAAIPIDAYVELITTGLKTGDELVNFFEYLKRGEISKSLQELKNFSADGGSALKGIHALRTMATIAAEQKNKIESIIRAADLIGNMLTAGTVAVAAGGASAGAGAGAGAAAGSVAWKVVAGNILKQVARPVLEWIVDEFSKYSYSPAEKLHLKKNPSDALSKKWQFASLGKKALGAKSEKQLYDKLYQEVEVNIFSKLEAINKQSEQEEDFPDDPDTEEVSQSFKDDFYPPEDLPPEDGGPPYNFMRENSNLNEQKYIMLLERFKIK